MSKVSLSNFIESYGDGIHGTPTYDISGDYYFINGNNLENGKIRIDSDTPKISLEEFNRIQRPLGDNSLLISINGTLGKIALYDGEKIALGKSACYVNIKKGCNKYFVKYILSTKEFQKYIQIVAHGSTIKNLAPSQIAEYSFEFPDTNKPDKIASVLKVLDDKIANNNAINAELEALAKTIYDYWFLQFEFPNEEGLPYKSSGGRMVWSEELKREIPEGWEVKNIRAVCDIVDCLHSKKPDYSFEDENYYLLQLENLTSSGYIDLSEKYFITKEDYLNWTSKIEIQENDFVITNAGRTGAVGMIPAGVKCALGRNFTAIRPKMINPYYLRMFLQSPYMEMQIKSNLDSGAFFKSFNVKSIKEILVLVPDTHTLTRASEIFTFLVKKIEQQIAENRELAALRDWLLPMLMNGQVGFKEEVTST